MSIRELQEILSLTIKHDDANKCLIFLAMLSAFTENSQINVSLNAQSSAGKTYLPTEIAKFFPKDSKVVFSNATPTALFYGESRHDKQRKARIVDFERKILIFLEQPDSSLQANLRSLLSHDAKESVYSRTNRTKTGENRAEKIIILGFPSTIFCSACGQIDEQEATRFLMLSPEDTPQKIESAIDKTLLMSADPNMAQRIENDPCRLALIDRIERIRDTHVNDIIISDPNLIKTRFQEIVGGELSSVRYMRDIAHILHLIKAVALLNIWHREKDGKYYANTEDIDTAFKLWQTIAKSQSLNIPPMALKFLESYIIPAYKEKVKRKAIGVTVRDVLAYYNKRTRNNFSDVYLRKNILIPLNMAGLITLQTNPVDKRQKIIIPVLPQ